MAARFHIEDLVVQDASGVVFRATDANTGGKVALRRFFPFGPDGGGLSEDERADYAGVIGRLREIHHPGLRETIAGGCDEVDSIPFLATEALPGTPLEAYLERGPLTPEDAAAVLTRAMEICELISAHFDHDEVWIDTSLRWIIAADGESGRGITFWVAPLKFLGKHPDGRGLDPLAALAENLMGWRGRAYNPQTVSGLAAWIVWLRESARTANLREALSALTRFMAADSAPAPAPAAVVPPAPAPAPKRKKHPVLVTFLTAVIALALLAGGAWWLIQRDAALREKAHAPPIAATEIPATSAELGGAFTPEDGELLLANSKKSVALEGVLEEIGHSDSGSTMYLLFSKSATAPRGLIRTKNAPADLSESALAGLKGKRIRIQGIVRREGGSGPPRPVIRIDSRNAITVVE